MPEHVSSHCIIVPQETALQSVNYLVPIQPKSLAAAASSAVVAKGDCDLRREMVALHHLRRPVLCFSTGCPFSPSI